MEYAHAVFYAKHREYNIIAARGQKAEERRQQPAAENLNSRSFKLSEEGYA